MFAVGNRALNQVFGDCSTANQLDKNIDIGIFSDSEHIMGERYIGKIEVRILAPCADLHNANLTSCSRLNFSLITKNHFYGTAANSTQATYTDINWFQSDTSMLTPPQLNQGQKIRNHTGAT